MTVFRRVFLGLCYGMSHSEKNLESLQTKLTFLDLEKHADVKLGQEFFTRQCSCSWIVQNDYSAIQYCTCLRRVVNIINSSQHLISALTSIFFFLQNNCPNSCQWKSQDQNSLATGYPTECETICPWFLNTVFPVFHKVWVTKKMLNVQKPFSNEETAYFK